MKYERPELDFVEFDVVDVIQTSVPRGEDDLPFAPASTAIETTAIETTAIELDEEF